MTDNTKTTDSVLARDQIVELLQKSVVEVTFTKLNGDRRVMTCTLMPDRLPPAKAEDPLSLKKIREINEAVISVWDVNAAGWRSFRLDRVESVVGAGES
jgi:hypothetical protein